MTPLVIKGCSSSMTQLRTDMIQSLHESFIKRVPLVVEINLRRNLRIPLWESVAAVARDIVEEVTP